MVHSVNIVFPEDPRTNPAVISFSVNIYYVEHSVKKLQIMNNYIFNNTISVFHL